MRQMFAEPGYRFYYHHSVTDGEMSHRSVFRGDDLTLVLQSATRRKPMRWSADISYDHFFVLLNLSGTMLVRKSGEPEATIVLPRSLVVASGPVVVSALLGRGEHRHLVYNWPFQGTESLRKWWTEVSAESGVDGAVGVASCPTGSFIGDVFDTLVLSAGEKSERNLPKISGSLGLAVGEAMTNAVAYQLTQDPKSEFPDAISGLMYEVRQRPQEPWTLREAASHAGYSPFHLSRTFKAFVGYGFPEFVERCRTERAIGRVVTVGPQIDEIAVESGFTSSQGLRDACRDYLGFLPSEMRAFGLELVEAAS